MTPIYPATDSIVGITPVVHYFANEWVKLGYNVRVVNSQAVYPSVFYKLPEAIYRYAEKVFGFAVKRNVPRTNAEFKYERVNVKRICIKKILPTFDFKDRDIRKHYEEIYSYLNEVDFEPDYIVGHWDSPTLLLTPFFRKRFPNSTISVVLHGDMAYISKNNGKNRYFDGLKDLNVLGFRSKAIMERFEQLFPHFDAKKFICYSGVPDEFINKITSIEIDKVFSEDTWNFLFVGMLVNRKYPEKVLDALIATEKQYPFHYTVVGEGAVGEKIKKLAIDNNVTDKVSLLGRIPRGEVMDQMVKAQCFVMISKETFGLVYIEAMLSGCLVIASRNQGIDGVIIDGYNGYLCEVGDESELREIILKIRSTPLEKLEQISKNAIETAKQYSDSIVAKEYLNSVGAL